MNIESYLARMERLVEEYTADAMTLEKNRKPSELFGLKFGPADDERHDRFGADMAALLSDFAGEQPDSASLRVMLTALYAIPKTHPEPKSAYWMLVAVQGLSRELIPGLSAPDAQALLQEYEIAWPRRSRLPVQDSVRKALRQAAK